VVRVVGPARVDPTLIRFGLKIGYKKEKFRDFISSEPVMMRHKPAKSNKRPQKTIHLPLKTRHKLEKIQGTSQLLGI
jgi:hypothetical protein